MKKLLLITFAVATTLSILTLAGCGGGVSLEDGRARIAALVERGVPESEMSALRMYLFNMETAQRTGNSSAFRTFQDSLTTALAEFEERMEVLLAESGPFMDSVRRAADDKIAQLRGLHLDAANRGKGRVDSLMQIESQKLNARYRLEAWSRELDTLVEKQQLADSLRPHFVGLWVTEKESPNPQERIIERTEIRMTADGGLTVRESRRSNTPIMREDWLFESTGTWDLLGDVAHHYITREKRVRNIFEALDPETGRWRRETHPPYDSVVAPGTKDRFAAWSALNADYKFFPIRR